MKVVPTGNALLARVKRNDSPLLCGKFQEIVVKAGTELSSHPDSQNFVYFPCDEAVLSLRLVLSPKLAIECGAIGSEGAWPIDRTDGANILIKVFRGGRLLCVDAAAFEDARNQSASTQELFARYSADLLKSTMQLVACNAAHSADQRLARWLLQMTDQSQTNILYTTHEDVASVIGVGRSYVTRMLAKFLHLGAIRYRRGSIEVINADVLRGVSCGCKVQTYHQLAISNWMSDGLDFEGLLAPASPRLSDKGVAPNPAAAIR